MVGVGGDPNATPDMGCSLSAGLATPVSGVAAMIAVAGADVPAGDTTLSRGIAGGGGVEVTALLQAKAAKATEAPNMQR